MFRASIASSGTFRQPPYHPALIGLLSTLWLATPAVGDILIDGEPALPGKFLTLEEIPLASSPEDRIAAYAKALAAAGELVPAPMTAEVYERLGVALLSAARLARFRGELEPASAYLLAARHVFDLAGRAALVDGEAAAGDTGLLHRAIVGLEEILVTDSPDAWPEVAGLLTRQLERAPTGPLADWVLRILHHPETYVGEEDAMLVQRVQVAGGIRKPEKIFAPQALYTQPARRARIEGVVITQAVIDRHGHVAALKVIKGLPMGLTDEALRTMATWLFEPATFGGQPVAVSYFLTMSFRL